MKKGTLFVSANVSHLDFSKTPCNYTTSNLLVEVKTIHLAKRTARVVFNNPTKLKRKETSDISISRFDKNDITDIVNYVEELLRYCII